MSLNIKNEATHRAVRQLARLTGESQTSAVDQAVRERLERLSHNKKKSLATELMEMAKECRQYWKEPYRSTEHGDLLYDENGLPK